MSNRTRIAGTVLLIGLVVVVAGLLFTRRGEPREEPVTLPQVLRSQLELREGVLYGRGESQPFEGAVVEYFPGGVRRIELEIRDGRPHGLSRGWYENGQLEVEEHFVRGVSQGPRTRWYESGAKKSESLIVDGKIEGIFRRWHENGQKAMEAAMADGVPHGVSEAWYPSGAPKSRAVLKGGEIVSREFFEPRGALSDG